MTKPMDGLLGPTDEGDVMGKYTKFMDRLADLMVEDLMEMSDEEIMAEALEQYGSEEAVNAEVERLRSIIQSAIDKHNATNKQIKE